MWSAPPASSLLYFMFVYSRPTCDVDDEDSDDHDRDDGDDLDIDNDSDQHFSLNSVIKILHDMMMT